MLFCIASDPGISFSYAVRTSTQNGIIESNKHTPKKTYKYFNKEHQKNGLKQIKLELLRSCSPHLPSEGALYRILPSGVN